MIKSQSLVRIKATRSSVDVSLSISVRVMTITRMPFINAVEAWSCAPVRLAASPVIPCHATKMPKSSDLRSTFAMKT